MLENPSNENSSFAGSPFNFMEKFPSPSDTVPLVVPFSITFAKGSAVPSASAIFPVTVCAIV